MKYYIIAGEASGDLHGSNLISELKKLDPAANIRCWGGDKMKAAGANLVRHYRDHAYMGFAEVLSHLPQIFKNLKACKEDIARFNPDALILIDYPGFNLRIASWAKKQGLKIIYYISPQVWAWKSGRVKAMKQNIDKMLVILPFEKDYFKTNWDWDVEYVGHPLLDEIGKRKVESGKKERGAESGQNNIVALLPGSRKQEIEKKLPIMLEVVKYFPDHKFIIAKAPAVDDGFYNAFTAQYDNVDSVREGTYNILSKATAALVTSGTATLETALFDVPEVVCYKSSYLSYQIGKRLVKVKYISLVNLIMDRPVVKELIQEDLTAEKLFRELNEILNNDQLISRIKMDYAELRDKLRSGGNASQNAAHSIMSFLKKEA